MSKSRSQPSEAPGSNRRAGEEAGATRLAESGSLSAGPGLKPPGGEATSLDQPGVAAGPRGPSNVAQEAPPLFCQAATALPLPTPVMSAEPSASDLP